MSDYSNIFDLVVPAGNGTQTFTLFTTSLGLADVQRILTTWPPGCAGLVGVSLHLAGSPVYPNKTGQYYNFDGYTYELAVQNQVTSGQWSINAYNLDFVPHTLQVVFEWNIVNSGSNSSFSSSPISL